MRAAWTASGACTSGSTAHPRDATRTTPASGGVAMTSTASTDLGRGAFELRTSGIERTKNGQRTETGYDENTHTLLRRMRLRCDSLRIHGRTIANVSLSLSGLPALQRRSVFVLRHRSEGSFQALARLAALL